MGLDSNSSDTAGRPLVPDNGVLGWGPGEDAVWLSRLLPVVWRLSRCNPIELCKPYLFSKISHDLILDLRPTNDMSRS